jgi:predicted outer membrane protein
MNRTTLIAAAAFATSLLAAAPCRADAPPPLITSDISGSDLDFFMGAARETALITRMSEMAKRDAVTPEVQSLAAIVAREQGDAAARLKDLAAHKAVQLPEEPDGAGRKELQTLGAMVGPRFDKSYLDALVEAQGSLDTSLQAGAASTDKDIKALAQKGQGTLKAERDQIRKLGM